MRKLWVLSAVFGLFLGVNQAIAADLTDERTSYEPPMAPIWGGLYVGGHIGGLWSSDDSIGVLRKCKDEKCYCPNCRTDNWTEVTKHSYKSDDEGDVSLLGGLHIGYNVQDGNMVYGAEADVSFADNVDYLASLRARVGYAANELLIYATAGVALAGFDNAQLYRERYNGSKRLLGESDDDTRVGFVVGGGVEYKLSSNLSLGLEGLYYAFGDLDESYGKSRDCYELKISHEDDNDFYVVRTRLSYHLQDAYEAPLK